MFRESFLLLVLLSCHVLGQLDDPVYFSAIKGSTNGNYIAFQAVIANNKADFTSSYGAFKVTQPGTYKFSYSAVSPEGTDLRVSLRSNGIPVITSYSGGASFETASGNMILTLDEGDLVYLFVEKGDIFESNKVNRAYTSFCGHQISATKPKGGMFSGLLGRTAHPKPATESLMSVLEKDEGDNLAALLRSNTSSVGNK